MQSSKLVATLALLLLCGAPLAFAQSQITTGTISGIVTDETGGAIPNAKVVLRNTDKGVERTLTTDGEGRFIAPLLEVGQYQITASAPGFATLVSQGYTLTLGQTSNATLVMKPASVTESVTITEQAPIVETSRTDVSTLVDNRSVQNLPLNGRRFTDLAFLTPGVSTDPERGNLSFAGQRGINSNINIDGADFNQPFFGGQRGGERSNSSYVVSQEAIREFQVIRSGFAPEFGRSTGGLVNVITKSGTNDFHGGAFYYLRHREFSPRNVFGEDVAPTRQQFGGHIGGRIIRDKTFFYNVWDQQEEKQALNIRFNNPAGLPANLLAQQGRFESTNDIKTYLVKIDHQLTEGTRIIGRYNMSRNDAKNGTFSGITTGTLDNNGFEQDRTHTFVGNVNTVISPSLLNEFRSQYSYESRPRLQNGEGTDYKPLVGPQIQVSGCCFFGGVSYLPVVQNDDRIQIANNVSWIKGAHNLKFGFDFNRSHVSQIFRGNWRGVYIFNNVQNFVNALNRVPGATADQFRIFFGKGDFEVAVKEIAGFVQDQWKIGRRLTLTGGFRYEAVINPQPIAPNPLLPQTSQIPNDTKEYQPRLGLSWDLFGTGKTVFRASTGIFFARTPMLLLNQAFNSTGNPNVGVSFTLNGAQIAQAQRVRPDFVFPFVPDTSSAANARYLTEAGIAGLRPDASFFSPDFRNPRSFNVSAGFEQALTDNLAIGLDWVHLNTVWLQRIRDVNLAPPVLQLDTSTPPQLRPVFSNPRPNTSFNILRSQESSARSNYDGLTLSLNRRFSNRFSFLTNYTLAWNRDSDSNERNFAGIAYENAFDLSREYTWARNDVRQRWVFSGTYDLPWGFQVGGIQTWRTGLPFSAFTSEDSNRDNQFTDKPIVGGVWFGRNQFRQPDQWNTDLRVSRYFRIREGHSIQFISEFFNLFSLKNYQFDVSNNESSTTALGSRWGRGQTPLPTFATVRLPDGSLNRGGITLARPVQLQLALKYIF